MLKNPSLTFYGFQIRNSLQQGSKPVAEASKLWEELAKIDELKDLKKYLICYQNNQYDPTLEDKLGKEFLTLSNQPQTISFDFSVTSQSSNIPLKGSLTPYRLHDTYAIDLTLNSDIEINLNDLKELNWKYFSSLNPSLGSTLIFYAEPCQPSQDYNSLADTCIKELFNSTDNLKLIAKNFILKCPLFVYDNEEIEPNKQRYILVWFNPEQVKIEPLISERLLYLFWFRHKILYAYHQSRQLDEQGRKEYAKIEEYIKNFNSNLKSKSRLEELKTLLTSSFETNFKYSVIIRDIQDYKSTIISNLDNFKQTGAKLKALPDTNLEFLEQFISRSEFFLKQINTDLSFLSPGEKLLQNLIENIRGIVAIDQLQQDEKSQEQQKNIENLITFLGFGLAVSSISSAVSSEAGQNLTKLTLTNPICQENNTPLDNLCLGALNLSFHLLLGLILAIPLSTLFLWLFPKIMWLLSKITTLFSRKKK